MTRALIVTLTLCLCLPLAAQQVGDSMRDYTVNGVGAGGTSPVANQLLAPGSFDQNYNTLDPGMPLVWVSGSTLVGSVVTPNNSVDLNPLTFNYLAVGGDPSSFFNQFFYTDGTGAWGLNAVIGSVTPGTTVGLLMAHPSQQVPEGWLVSQVQQMSFVQDGNLSPGSGAACNPGGMAQIHTDDSSVLATLGFTFTYYGVQYTDCYVCSNGFISFGISDTDFSESVAEMLSNAPRIAMYWDDLYPPNGGTINFYTDNLSIAEVCFNLITEIGQTTTNDFRCQMTNLGAIFSEYGAMAALDGLVGCSPGNNLDPTGTPINLSIANNPINPGAAAYELFDGINTVNDLSGFQVTWILDPLGNPILQL